MMQRCYNKKSPSYKYYGGKGVSVCDRWHEPKQFIKDMGNRPDGLSIDRIDGNGNYCIENCRWVTPAIQSRNKDCLKLSMEKAKDIRSMYSDGYSKESISKKYSVSICTIRDVVTKTRKRSWE